MGKSAYAIEGAENDIEGSLITISFCWEQKEGVFSRIETSIVTIALLLAFANELAIASTTRSPKKDAGDWKLPYLEYAAQSPNDG